LGARTGEIKGGIVKLVVSRSLTCKEPAGEETSRINHEWERLQNGGAKGKEDVGEKWKIVRKCWERELLKIAGGSQIERSGGVRS